MKKEHLKIVYLVLGMVAIGAVVFGIIKFQEGSKSNGKSITNFEECAEAGYPIMESYPRQCRANDQLFVEKIPAQEEPIKTSGCAVAGCSGQLCVDADKASDIVTTCEYRPEYACYKEAACEKQTDGQCGWTQTAQLKSCLISTEDKGSLIQ